MNGDRTASYIYRGGLERGRSIQFRRTCPPPVSNWNERSAKSDRQNVTCPTSQFLRRRQGWGGDGSLEMRLVQAGTHPARHRRGQPFGLANHLAAHRDVGEGDPLTRQEGLLLERLLQRGRGSGGVARL